MLSKPIFFLLLLLLASMPLAESYVAINSIDGRDVLSGIFYANVKGYPVHFVPASGGSSGAFAAKVGSNNEVLLIQSATTPASGFVESELRAKNNSVELYPTTDGGKTNLELAARSGAGSFIIVDSAYSDSALSVMPYAALTKSYVLLADSANAQQIGKIVAGKKVIAYGLLDGKVSAAIAPENPAQIGDGEDKYADNVLIAGKILDEFHPDRAILSDGSVLEDAMVSTGAPIILTGRIMPQVTYDFIKSEFRQGRLSGLLLIGNSLIYPTYDMRERMKNELAAEGTNSSIGVMVKFAQAVPSQGGSVVALDTFSMPAYKPSLAITEIFYNPQSKKAAISLENTGEGPLYYTLELRVKLDGADYLVFTQPVPTLIERGASAGNEYPLDLSAVQEGAVSATALVKYGSSKKSLEGFATSEGKLTAIAYADESNVSVRLAKYDREKQQLSITVKNNGEQAAYFFPRLAFIDESGSQVKVSGPSIREIEPSSLFIEEFPLQLSDAQMGLNKEIQVSVDYGGRRGFLLKNATYVVPLESSSQGNIGQLQPMLFGAAVAFVAFVLLLAAYSFIIKKRNKGI